jgi:hypothetical protein
MVTYIDSYGKRINITNKLEIEQAILNSNRKKFSQSFHTPFYKDPLHREFGFKGLTSATQATLAGVYESNDDLPQEVLDVIAK